MSQYSQHCRGRKPGAAAWRKFLCAHRGSAAIEFGLIAPALLTMVLTVKDITDISVGVGAMQTAMRASIQYAMNGGTDMTVAQTQGTQAWNNMPSGGTLTATKSCTCSGTSHSCTTLCSDNTSPQMYIAVSASATFGGTLISQPESLTETVRVK